MTVLEIPAGWTAEIDAQLLRQEVPYVGTDGILVGTSRVVPVDLTGVSSVELVAINRDGATVETTGDVSVIDALTGRVRYFPDSLDLVARQSPLRVRWKITDGSGRVSFSPSAQAWDTWIIGGAS